MGNLAYLFGQSAGIAAVPTAGAWYQVQKGDTPWSISKKAYADTGLATVKSGLYLLNDNPSNANIRKAAAGWEAYKIKGLQLTANYAPGVMYASYQSGGSYPMLWIPPIDGRTADQMGGGKGEKGDTGEAGTPGQTGLRGPKGDKGDPGHTPTSAEISALIADYMETNPPGGAIDPAAIARAVADYLKLHPVNIPAIDPDTIAESVAQYIKTHPPVADAAAMARAIANYLKSNPVEVPAVNPASIANAVSAYMRENPIAQGTQGPRGPAGPQGPAGPMPSNTQISSLIKDYMRENPVSSGGGAGFDMDTARDFVDARIRMALRNLPSGESIGATGTNMWPGLIAAGIFGGAIVVLLGKRKKRGFA